MKRILKHSLPLGGVAVFLLLLALFATGCKNEVTPSLYNTDYNPGVPPVINSVTPKDSAMAGVDVLTIDGSNFSPNPSENFVFFNADTGMVVSATPTQLKVKAPNLVKDTIWLKVAVLYAEKFSNTVQYKLLWNAAEFGGFTNVDEPWALAVDANGDLLVSLISRSVGVGVKKITPDGVVSNFAPAFSSAINKWSGMKIGPGGYLYAVTGRNIIFRMNPTGGAPTVWKSGGGLGTLWDLDFDQQGNIWAGGNATSVFRVKPDLSVQGFPFTADVKCVRVYNNYLYVAGVQTGASKIWRFPLNADGTLGSVEEYFNFSTSAFGTGGKGAFAITFNTDGDMYVGTDATASVVIVHPDKSAEALYPGVLQPQTLFFAWGKGTTLYSSRRNPDPSSTAITSAIIKLNTRKTGAPYFGVR